MAEPGALPTGFGELEVLAVGTLLLVEGEPGRSWGGNSVGSQNPGHSCKVSKPCSSGPGPIESSDSCTCGTQHEGWEPRERRQVKVREGGALRGGTPAQGMTKNQSCPHSQKNGKPATNFV